MRKATIFLILAFLFYIDSFAEETKKADLAGSWYPQSGIELERLIDGYLEAAHPEEVAGEPFAIISPHAGFQFSGPVAAYGFKAVRGKNIKTVILIGFSHGKSFNAIAIYDRGAFETPLGAVAVDAAAAAEVVAQNRRISFYPEAFRDENSIEMQIPFIQIALPGAKIVPIAFGTQNFQDAVILADALAKTLKNRNDFLIVASTDLSHYHPYNEANSIDKYMMGVLTDMNAKKLYDEAYVGMCELCGMMPVASTLLLAERLGHNKIKVLRYANSGDTFGDKSRVVGYLSAIIYKEGSGEKKESAMLNDAQRKRLLQIARESITSFVKDKKRKDFSESDRVLNENMGAFVTLHEGGELRGCIGNMVGGGPLYKTVADMAIEAATGDPRFPALSPKELDKVDIEISVLSPMKKASNPEEIKVPGHGVLVRKGFRSGVYLPQVADETGWSKEEFMASLCAHKAGLPPDAWRDPATEVYVFSAEVFGEKGGGR